MSNYLLDKRFQLKYTLFVLVVSLAIFSVLGWLYYSQVRENTELMEVDESLEKILQQDGLEVDLDDEYSKEMGQDMRAVADARDLKTSLYLLLAVALLVFVLTGTGIYMTHKIAGPLYALSRFMNAAQQGNWNAIRPFRKGDEFVYLAEQFHKLAAQIKSKHEAELVVLKEMVASLEAGQSDEATRKLASLIADKEAYLEG